MDARRRTKRNELYTSIKETEVVISRHEATIQRLKNATTNIDYNRKKIDTLKVTVVEKKELLAKLKQDVKDVALGLLDDQINEEYSQSSAAVHEKHAKSMQERAEKRQEKKANKDTSMKYWNSVKQETRSRRQLQRDIAYSERYLQRVVDSLPAYMERNLAKMPNNKGYVWRGVHFYGKRPDTKGPTIVFEKIKGGILVIHEYTRTHYNRYEKEGNGKKVLVSSTPKRKR